MRGVVGFVDVFVPLPSLGNQRSVSAASWTACCPGRSPALLGPPFPFPTSSSPGLPLPRLQAFVKVSPGLHLQPLTLGASAFHAHLEEETALTPHGMLAGTALTLWHVRSSSAHRPLPSLPLRHLTRAPSVVSVVQSNLRLPTSPAALVSVARPDTALSITPRPLSTVQRHQCF